ncbi:unnamed protein product [Rhodiola kirilowii]
MATCGKLPDPQPAATSKGQVRSFVAVARGQAISKFPTVKLAPRQYELKDGKPVMSFTQAELQPGLQKLQFSLIAKFLASRPQIEEVRRLMNQAWALEEPVTIGAMDARHVLIILSSTSNANRLLAHFSERLEITYSDYLDGRRILKGTRSQRRQLHGLNFQVCRWSCSMLVILRPLLVLLAIFGH